MEHPVPQLAALEPACGPVKGGTETLLLVEDGDPDQPAATGMLQALGYRVLRASDSRAALQMLESGVQADLLLADCARSGPQLAAGARQRLPGIALLFTGASAADATAHRDTLEAGAELLARPYRPEDLARTIRHVLGNQQQVNALARALHERQAPRPAPPPAQARPLAVLLVDDQHDVRDTSRQLLELLGCEVQAVASAEAAESALQRARFDVVLTDISLPGRSGLDLAREAARLQPHATVVLSSGYATAADGAGVAAAGVRSLPKPYGLAELEALLRELRRD